MASDLDPQLTRRWSWDHPVGVAGSSRHRPLLPDLVTAFGASRGSIGWVQSVVSIAGVLLSALIRHLGSPAT